MFYTKRIRSTQNTKKIRPPGVEPESKACFTTVFFGRPFLPGRSQTREPIWNLVGGRDYAATIKVASGNGRNRTCLEPKKKKRYSSLFLLFPNERPPRLKHQVRKIKTSVGEKRKCVYENVCKGESPFTNITWQPTLHQLTIFCSLYKNKLYFYSYNLHIRSDCAMMYSEWNFVSFGATCPAATRTIPSPSFEIIVNTSSQ